MMFLTHRAERAKTYVHERVGSFGPRQLGISTDFRLLPLSQSAGDPVMQELGLFHSATLGGYYSLTGHRMALTSQRVYDWLPTEPEGVLPPTMLPALLRSHLMRTYNARYVLAARADTAMVRFIGLTPGYRRIAETSRALIYANDGALPRFYFASEIRPLGREEMRGSLIENGRPVTCALVSGTPPREGPVPQGRVERSSWEHERVAAEVVAPEGGFLVVSMAYSPDWVARVDGRPATLWVTNAILMGLEVPPGARSVVLRYQPPSFRRGLWLALLGLGVLAGTLVGIHRRRDAGPAQAA